MGYIGQPLNAGNLAVQTGTGDGADTTPIATLDYSVGSSESLAIYLDGVKQAVSTYTASGTTLTFTTAPPNGVGIEVVFLALPISLPTPGDGTVDETKLKDALIADFTEVVVTASDSILLGDATDSGNTKRDTVQGILDLVPAAGGITLATNVDATSGTTVDFTGIPSGTKRIIIMWHSVSTDGTNVMTVRLGDSGGFETTSYVGTCTDGAGTDYNYTGSTGFAMNTVGVAAALYSGHLILTLQDAATFRWVGSGVLGYEGAGDMYTTAGSKGLSAELTQVRITTVGTPDDFDGAGDLNISYE